MKKGLLITILALCAAGYAISFLPLGFLQPSIERAIQRGLGRRVEIGETHLALWNGPGVSLEQVTIHEDPRAGLEPFAYAETVQARLDLFALLHGHLRFASLRFDDASLNLVKPNHAPWNFQMLMEGGGAQPSVSGSGARVEAPAIRMRTGRVNLKFDQTKAVVFFDDVDLDVSSREAGNHRVVEVRFSGVPARTDRPARNLEHFFIQGTYDPSASSNQMNFQAELEPSPLDAVARLFVRQTFPMKGSLAMQAQISGPPGDLRVTGDLHMDTGAKWSYQGKLDLPNQQLLLESVVSSNASSTREADKEIDENDKPAPIRIHVWDLLGVPHWEASLEHAPLETFVSLARRLGAPMPDGFTMGGFADGSLAYRDSTGIAGQVDLDDVSLRFPVETARGAGRTGGAAKRPEIEPLHIARASIAVQNGVAVFGPAILNSAEGNVELSAKYPLNGIGEPSDSGPDFQMTSRGLDLSGLDARMVSVIPVLQNTSQGIWRGSLRYHAPAAGFDAGPNSGWTGDFDLLNARVNLEGFAEPLRVQSATVNVKSDRVDVSRLRAHLGQVALNGEYHWDFAPGKPQTFRLQSGDISAQELGRLFAPVLLRGGGFLARTLRLGSGEPPPDWLARRKVDGIVSGQLVFAQTAKAQNSADVDSDVAARPLFEDDLAPRKLKIDNAHVVWNGLSVALTGGRLALDDAPVAGQLTMDLSGRAPSYHFAGRVDGAPYKAGKLDVDGTVDAEGAGLDLLSSLRAQGTFRGQAIAFSPEVEFRRAAGRFELRIVGGTPRIKLSELEVMQGNDAYTGEGSTQGDGKLVLDLVNGGRQVRYTGTPVSLLLERPQ